MKICYITNNIDYKNGWGRYASELINGMERLGHETIIFKEVDDGHRGAKVVMRGLGSVSSIFKIRKTIRDCDVIHALDAYPFGILAFISNIFINKPIFITAQGTYTVAPLHKILTRFLTKLALKKSKSVIAISNYTKERILEEVDIKNLIVINHGINLDKFKNEINRDRKNYIIGVGALKYRKGYHVSIPAFAIARKKLGDLKYKIVGNRNDIGYFQELKDLTKKYNVENHVDFVTNISDEELQNLYGQAKSFILTSMNEGNHFEGFGLVFLEAAAFGLPVIGTLGNGIEDAIHDGYNGILVPQDNIDKTTDAILNTMQDKQKWDKMSNASIDWTKQHDINETLDKYNSLYNRFL